MKFSNPEISLSQSRQLPGQFCSHIALSRRLTVKAAAIRWAGLVCLLPLVLAACASSGHGPPPEPVEGEHALIVQIRGLDCCEGALRVALYNAEVYWLKDGQMVRGQVAPVLAEDQVVEFTGLPSGDYAVAIYQDLNTNMRLDRFLGLIPREPYGFSNNPGGVGRPSFQDAAVHTEGQTEIVIEMRPPPF